MFIRIDRRKRPPERASCPFAVLQLNFLHHWNTLKGCFPLILRALRECLYPTMRTFFALFPVRKNFLTGMISQNPYLTIDPTYTQEV